jgi:hypothetical protein
MVGVAVVAAIATLTLRGRGGDIIGTEPGDRHGKPAAGNVVTAVVRGEPRADTCRV